MQSEIRKPMRGAWPLLFLALAAGIARWLTRSQLIYSWDTVHYILAQDHYDITTHQPHPPGSFYYVMLAKALRVLTGDAHLSLLVISAVFGGALVWVLFQIGRELGGERVAWLSAALAATAPIFWFYGSIGLNYGPSGTISALVALGCIRLCKGKKPLQSGLLIAGALGVLGGFRPTDVVFLFPAALWSFGTFWRLARLDPSRTDLRRQWSLTAAASVALLSVLTAGWLIPNAVSAGGIWAYFSDIHAMEALLGGSSAFFRGLWALNQAAWSHRRALESAFGVTLLPVLIVALRWGLGLKDRRRPDTPTEEPRSMELRALVVLGMWIVTPAFLFYLLGHFNSPGYTLTYSGFLAVLGAIATYKVLDTWTSAPQRPALVFTGVLAANAVLFLFGWPLEARLTQRGMSNAELRDHDRYYNELREKLAPYKPGTVRVLCSWPACDGLRMLKYMMPEHEMDIAQVVPYEPDLPPYIVDQPWLTLMTPEQLDREHRTLFAVTRTRDDVWYQEWLLGKDFFVKDIIGTKHWVLRIDAGDPIGPDEPIVDPRSKSKMTHAPGDRSHSN